MTADKGRADATQADSPVRRLVILGLGNFGSLGLGAIAGLLLARLLGPVGRGDWALICFWPVLISSVALFGIDSMVVRGWTSGASRRRSATAGIKTLATTLPIWLVICLFAVSQNVGRRFPHLASEAFLLSLLVIPYAIGMYSTNLLLYWRGPTAHSLVRIFQPAIYVATIAAMAILQLIEIEYLVIAFLALYTVWSMLASYTLWRTVERSASASKGEGDFSFAVTAKQGFATLPVHLANNMPFLFLALKSTPAQAGYFVAANSVTQLLMPFAYALAKGAALTFAHLSETERMNWIRRRFFAGLILLLLVGLAISMAAEYVVKVLFGTSYLPSVPVLQILVIAGALQGSLIVVEEAVRIGGKPSAYMFARFIISGLAMLVVVLAVQSLGAVDIARVVLCVAALESTVVGFLAWRGKLAGSVVAT